ncbi:MAG TPA: hypothetical protein VJT32_02830 [bacterium]|nr:hypothetical protein [bacterium]
MWRPTRAEVEAINRLLYEEMQAIRDRLNTLLDDGEEDPGDNHEITEGGEKP